MMGLGILTLFLFGQAPHDLDCRGRFEVLARIEPARILVGEDVILTLRIVALGPWKRGPERPPLTEDASLLSHFRVRDVPDEAPSRFPEGITGPTGTAWEYSWKLTPLREAHGPKTKDPKPGAATALYPAAITEIGLILTRDDVPWPRLAREMIWVGPFPLTYRQMETVSGSSGGSGIGWAMMGMGVWVVLTLMGMLVYENLLFKRAFQRLSELLTSNEPIDPRKARKILHAFFRERGLVLPAEPDAALIGQATLRAGYSGALATLSADLWGSLDRAAFGPAQPFPTTSRRLPSTQDKELANRVMTLAASRDWRFWKRRLTIEIY